MSKSNSKKTTVPKIVPAAPAPAVKRSRESVLLKVTASKLRDLIGADTEIGVSRKELNALVTKQAAKSALAAAGL